MVDAIHAAAAEAEDSLLHPVQQAWLDEDVAACGFCQAGQIMAAAALLADMPNPTDADIDALENVCRCGIYFPHPQGDQASGRRPVAPMRVSRTRRAGSTGSGCR